LTDCCIFTEIIFNLSLRTQKSIPKFLAEIPAISLGELVKELNINSVRLQKIVKDIEIFQNTEEVILGVL